MPKYSRKVKRKAGWWCPSPGQSGDGGFCQRTRRNRFGLPGTSVCSGSKLTPSYVAVPPTPGPPYHPSGSDPFGVPTLVVVMPSPLSLAQAPKSPFATAFSPSFSSGVGTAEATQITRPASRAATTGRERCVRGNCRNRVVIGISS